MDNIIQNLTNIEIQRKKQSSRQESNPCPPRGGSSHIKVTGCPSDNWKLPLKGTKTISPLRRTKTKHDIFIIYICDSVGSVVHLILLKVLESAVRNLYFYLYPKRYCERYNCRLGTPRGTKTAFCMTNIHVTFIWDPPLPWPMIFCTRFGCLTTKLRRDLCSERSHIVAPRFNDVPRDWENWSLAGVRYIENLVITNLWKNNQNVRYIGVYLIINRPNEKRRQSGGAL